MNLIRVTKKGNSIKYSINKDYEQWKALPKKVTVTKKGNSGITNNGNKGLPKKVTKVLPKKVHTKDNKDIFKNNIKDRAENFKNEIKKYYPNYSKEMLNNFYLYWSEPNKSKTKMKFEMQRTWDLSRRLHTWNRNEKKWDKNGKSITESELYEFAESIANDPRLK